MREQEFNLSDGLSLGRLRSVLNVPDPLCITRASQSLDWAGDSQKTGWGPLGVTNRATHQYFMGLVRVIVTGRAKWGPRAAGAPAQRGARCRAGHSRLPIRSAKEEPDSCQDFATIQHAEPQSSCPGSKVGGER